MPSSLSTVCLRWLFAGVALWEIAASRVAASLEDQLRSEGPSKLAAAARATGDAVRGAVVFHQPYLACSKCHRIDSPEPGLGPDLSRLDPPAADADIVESILDPSKVVRAGFAGVSVETTDGRSLTGLLVEDAPGRLVLRDAAQPGATLVLRPDQIERRAALATSVMPSGQVNQLGSRQQFLDLVRYLVEIRDGGPARALELAPPAALFVAEIPEYESHLDHAGLVDSLDGEALRRGEAIYQRVCVNCHGTPERPGSLPTSLRFASGRFKNGSDPWSMYQTLTRGFGMMAPQTWMVPQQKYDVIHYIREAYLRPHNSTQYVPTDAQYVARLPRGDTRGPAPTNFEPWIAMDYGPHLAATYEVGHDRGNFAYKGIALRLDAGPGGVSRGKHWALFDHDTLRVAAAWSRDENSPEPGFIDYEGIVFDGRHEAHPHAVGRVQWTTPSGPGWANPADGRWQDVRLRGRDGRPYGPLPRAWAHLRGLYHHEQDVVLSYTVGQAELLERLGQETIAATGTPLFTRTLDIGRSPHELVARLAVEPVAAAVIAPAGASLQSQDGNRLLRIPAASTPALVKVFLADCDEEELARYAAAAPAPAPLGPLTHGGPARWPQVLRTEATLGADGGPFAVDVLAHPADNPWLCQMRLTGLDFIDDDRLAVCSWDGDVWLVAGLAQLAAAGGAAGAGAPLEWRRIASGLFQPLGLKIVGGRIYVSCRDQIVALHDLDGDGETDFYENFNSDHQVTEHFHEFAMGLQTDAAGNFYYAKSARHALPALVPHHGTLLRVSPDGARTDILAQGFRAANGVCVNGDGSFVVTDQEGHWTPKNRINWVTPPAPGEPPRFYGNMFAYHDVTDAADAAMQQPVCWITNDFDRSPAELVWVPPGSWGPLAGRLLNLSYGHGKIYAVPHEDVAGHKQGGMVELPLPPFPTGIMRGRFHPRDGQLYACGMYAWAGNQQQPGGLYRVRYTGRPLWLPVELHARRGALELEFADPVDAVAAGQADRWQVTAWSLRRSADYGSPHVDTRRWPVSGVRVSQDGHRVQLTLPDLAPTWCLEVRYHVAAPDGQPIDGRLHGTIHALAD